MDRPPLEVADVIRAAGPQFLELARMYFSRQQAWKALNAILRCRTAALGGHIDASSRCGGRALSYNSCRNRHCPKCRGNARHRWLEARNADLLPTRYVRMLERMDERARQALRQYSGRCDVGDGARHLNAETVLMRPGGVWADSRISHQEQDRFRLSKN